MLSRTFPRVLWVAIGFLALGSVIHSCVFTGRGQPQKLIGPAISLALLIGLYLGHRWAYLLAIVGCVGMPILVGLEKGPSQWLVV